MDLPQFQAELTKLERLPEDAREHASIVAEGLSAEDRSEFLTRLQELQTEVMGKDGERLKLVENLENVVMDMEKKVKKGEREAMEKAGSDEALGAIEQKLSYNS